MLSMPIVSSTSHRFKFILREDADFKHTFYVDIFYIDKKPILHAVDEGTRVQTICWLPIISAQLSWLVLRRCWSDVYLGPSDTMVHDARKSFSARLFVVNAKSLYIRTKSVPVEAVHLMSAVKRYPSPLRKLYFI